MKSLVIVCVLALVGLSIAEFDPYPNGCIYVEGRCVGGCEEGTHAYATGCEVLTPEPTCENPEPKEDSDEMICDFTACYCNAPTVRDTVSNKCVPLEDCPKSQE
ncbi:unnamed protein product, partial [Brenthis ino]